MAEWSGVEKQVRPNNQDILAQHFVNWCLSRGKRIKELMNDLHKNAHCSYPALLDPRSFPSDICTAYLSASSSVFNNREILKINTHDNIEIENRSSSTESFLKKKFQIFFRHSQMRILIHLLPKNGTASQKGS